jgi:hypothetical protein
MPRRGEPGPRPRHDRRFVCRPLVSSRVTSESRLVYFPAAGGPAEMENDLLALSRSLQIWATFDEHLLALESAGHALTGHELAGALERLQQAGALWFDDEFMGELSSQETPIPPPITRFVVCTRDRPRELRRCLESFLGDAANRASVRLLVCDDSGDSAARLNAETLREIGQCFGVPCRQVDLTEKRRVIRLLSERAAQSGIASEVVEFILDGGFGAARNLALLLTAGELYLSADDDTLASAAASAAVPEGLELSCALNPTASDFFTTGEECDAAVPAADRDLFSEHGKFLGKGISALIHDHAGSPVMLSKCTAGLSRDLVSAGGSVLVTSAGLFGDSALGNPRMLFHLDGEARARYVENEARYRDIRLTRIVFRRAERPVLTNSPWLTAVNHAVDNRGLIPPTFPFGRNEDGLLGVLLRACRPNGYVLHVPQAVRHAPPEPRAFSEVDLHSFTPRICDFMIYAAHTARLNPLVRSPSDRMQTLASFYRAFGALSLPDFADAVRAVWMSFADGYISNMESRLEQYGHSPKAWALDVEKHLESLVAFLRTPGPLLPREIAASPAATNDDESLRLFQSSVELFGKALSAWPALRDIAAEGALEI